MVVTESVAILRVAHDRLAGCSSWPLRSAVYSSGRQFEPEVILPAVGWYLRFSLSYRDVEELRADHVTVCWWVQRYAPEVNRRLRSRLNSTNDSWRVDSDLHPSQGQVGIFIPRSGFQWGDHRLPSFGQARTPRPPSAFWPKPWEVQTIRPRG